MEKKGVAAVASLILTSLLAGMLLGGTVARAPPATIISTVEKTVTVAERTVEVPVKHQPVAYAALAYTECLYGNATFPGNVTDPHCDTGTKLMRIRIWLREVGTEESYIGLTGSTVIGMGLHPAGTLTGKPVDINGRVIVRPNKRAEVEILTSVTDAVSLANYVKDIGGISVELRFEDINGRPVATLMVTDIDVHWTGWTSPTNSTEVVPGG
jgi:hypothetical protein